MSNTKIIVALDFASKQKAQDFVDLLQPQDCKLKIGLEMFTQLGPKWVEAIVAKGFKVFLDLKYHDIPNTVSKACEQAVNLGVWMINVHVLGGQEMLKRARDVVVSAKAPNGKSPYLIGVTALTSLQNNDLKLLGIEESLENFVMRLSSICYSSGLNGVVCSAQEALMLKSEFGKEFLLVTPGIRMTNDNKDDQKRISTPHQAIKNGSDYIVMGRSITNSPNPKNLLNRLNFELEAL